MTLQFTGIYFAWIAKKSPVYGIAALTVDGGKPVTVDLYSASTLYQQKVWNSGLIDYGIHVVTIKWTGGKNPAASGTNVNLDAVQMIGALDPVGQATWTGPTAGTTIAAPETVGGSRLSDAKQGRRARLRVFSARRADTHRSHDTHSSQLVRAVGKRGEIVFGGDPATAVADIDDAVGQEAGVGIVGHHYDGVTGRRELAQQLED